MYHLFFNSVSVSRDHFERRKIMKTQLTPRCLLRVILCILALGCCARAGEIFFDDFSDGDIQDDTPVTWRWDASRGQCAVTPEGLQLRPSQTRPTMPESWLNAYAQKNGTDVQVTGNVSIRAQLNIGRGRDARGSVGLLSEPSSSYGIIIAGDGFFFARADGYWIPSWSVPNNGIYDPQEDVIIQLDAIDITDAGGRRISSRIEARVWMPGEEMPIEPQIVVTDDKYANLGFGIGAATNEPSSPSPTIFRWVKVTGSGVESEPIVDFNGDGTVDMKDLLKMINNWNQDEPSVDINGDGTVDENDLEILMEHWDQNVDDPTLLAHWALDETEGVVAYDSAGTYNAVLSGNPVWQPTEGQLNGALELDGIDDCIIAGPVLNPAEGPFSILAWVKGGAAGQVVVSELSSNWLCTDPSNGELTSELACQDRSTLPLLSQTVITDGEWHRIGLVWDGSNRTLYTDGVIVAQDTRDTLKGSYNGLYIGTGKAMEHGTFWSGLIDEVRVYKRAVSP
jgi:hypothetical protein